MPDVAHVTPVDTDPAPIRRSLQLAKMLAYFVLLGVGVWILQTLFREIEGTATFAELSRLSGVAASTLDTTKNVDELLVTLLSLLVTLVLVLPVAWVHMITRGNTSNPSLTQTLVVLSVIVAGVMLLLDDNLARSFGLVGVVAAVRYRHNLGSPKDAVYVFLALGIGMACGLHAYHVGLLLSVVECAILLVLWLNQTGVPSDGDVALLRALKTGSKKSELTAREVMSWLSPTARARLQTDLENHGRYLALADLSSAKKKPNAVITIEVDAHAATVRDRLTGVLSTEKGKWSLIQTEQRGDRAVLEYLGRCGKKRCPPVELLGRLREADPAVRHVAFRSLRALHTFDAIIAEDPNGPAPEPSAPHLTPPPKPKAPHPTPVPTGALVLPSMLKRGSP